MVYLANTILIFLGANLFFQNQGSYDYEIEPIGFYGLTESKIQSGYVHILTVSDEKEGKPKYLIYVVKSELPEAIEFEQLIEDRNIQVILGEISANQESEALLKVYNQSQGVVFKAGMNNDGKSLVFLTLHDKSLYKVVFISRNEEGFEKYMGEFNETLNTFKSYR